MKKKKLIWKGEEQRCCVLVEVGGKVHQVTLDEDGERSIIFILPQLFKDHTVKIMPEELPITFPKKKVKKAV